MIDDVIVVDNDDRNGLGDFLDFRSGTSEYGLLDRFRLRLRLRLSRLRRLLRLLRRRELDLDLERRDRDRDLERRLGRRSSR